MNRSRHLAKSILTSGLSRGLGALGPLVTVPIALQFLGIEAYGAWTAALALTAAAAFADLGIGAGLMTKLAQACADDDFLRARTLVSSAYFALGILVTGVLGILWLSSISIDWVMVIAGRSGASDPDLEPIILLTISAAIVNIVALLIVRVQYGAQQISRSNIWQAAGSLAGVAAIVIASVSTNSNAVFIAIAAFTPALVSVVNTVVFFSSTTGKSVRPSLQLFRLRETVELIRLGSKFLVITTLMAITLETDAWIVAQAVGLESVPGYAIPARIFALLGTVVAVLTIPLWPTNAQALRSGDTAWVIRTTRRMTVITLGVVVGLSAVAVAFVAPAIDWWLAGKIEPSGVLLLGLALWACAQAAVAPMFMVQNAEEVLSPQIIGYSLLLIVVPIKWIVASEFGVEWIPWVAAVLYGAFIWPAALIGYRRSVKQASKREQSLGRSEVMI